MWKYWLEEILRRFFWGGVELNDSLQEQGVEYKYLPLGLWREVKEYI